MIRLKYSALSQRFSSSLSSSSTKSFKMLIPDIALPTKRSMNKAHKQKLSSFTKSYQLSKSSLPESLKWSSSVSFMMAMMAVVGLWESNNNTRNKEILKEYISFNNFWNLNFPSFSTLHIEDFFLTTSDTLKEQIPEMILSFVFSDEEKIVENGRDKSLPMVKFPSLQTNMILNNKNGKEFRPFVLNSRDPIPVDNELFVGHVVLLVRPLCQSDDPSFQDRVGNDSDLMYVFQLQGRFKKSIPKSHLLIGGQTTQKMPIFENKWMKQVANLILRTLARRMNSSMTFSFGSNKIDPNDDTTFPHISFPLHSGLQRVIETPLTTKGGSTKYDDENSDNKIQITGKPFKGFDGDKNIANTLFTKEQAKNQEFWNPDVLYSMEFTADAIDLANWKVLSPLEMNLSRFWGASPIRLVIYERKEDNEIMNYVFNLEVEHIMNTKNVDNTFNSASSAFVSSSL